MGCARRVLAALLPLVLVCATQNVTCPLVLPPGATDAAAAGTCVADRVVGATCQWACPAGEQIAHATTGVCGPHGQWEGLEIDCQVKFDTGALIAGVVVVLVIMAALLLTIWWCVNKQKHAVIPYSTVAGEGGLGAAERAALHSVSDEISDEHEEERNSQYDGEPAAFVKALSAYMRLIPVHMRVEEHVAEIRYVLGASEVSAMELPTGATAVIRTLRSCIVAGARILDYQAKGEVIAYQSKSWLCMKHIAALTLAGAHEALVMMRAPDETVRVLKGHASASGNMRMLRSDALMSYVSALQTLVLYARSLIQSLTEIEGVLHIIYDESQLTKTILDVEEYGLVKYDPHTTPTVFTQLDEQFGQLSELARQLGLYPNLDYGNREEDAWDRAELPRQLLRSAKGIDRLRAYAKDSPFGSLEKLEDHLQKHGVTVGAVALESSFKRQQVYTFFPRLNDERHGGEIVNLAALDSAALDAWLHKGTVAKASEVTLMKEYKLDDAPNAEEVHSAFGFYAGMPIVFHTIPAIVREEQVTLLRELVASLRLLHHPALLRTMASIQNSYLTEHIPGARTLTSRMNEGGLAWPARREIGVAVARGLAFLHNCQPPIIHGCLTSGNVLITPNGHPLLMRMGLTVVDVLPKDRMYDAPELLNHARPSPTTMSDVYSYGQLALVLAGNIRADANPLKTSISARTARRATALGFIVCRDTDPRRRGTMNEIVALLEERTIDNADLQPSGDEAEEEEEADLADDTLDHDGSAFSFETYSTSEGESSFGRSSRPMSPAPEPISIPRPSSLPQPLGTPPASRRRPPLHPQSMPRLAEKSPTRPPMRPSPKRAKLRDGSKYTPAPVQSDAPPKRRAPSERRRRGRSSRSRSGQFRRRSNSISSAGSGMSASSSRSSVTSFTGSSFIAFSD